MDIDLSRKFRNLLIAIGLSVAAVLVIAGGMVHVHQVSAQAHEQKSGITADFLSKCSGQPYTDVSAGDDIAMCGTRISGFVAGYDLAIEQLQLANDDHRRLWCIPANADEALYVNTVRSWAEVNPDKYNHIIETMKASNDATIATAVIIAAFHATYPCTK